MSSACVSMLRRDLNSFPEEKQNSSFVSVFGVVESELAVGGAEGWLKAEVWRVLSRQVTKIYRESTSFYLSYQT